MRDSNVFGLAMNVMGGAISPDEHLMQEVEIGVLNRLCGSMLAVKVQDASGRGMGALVEYFDHHGRLLLRLPLASGRDSTRQMLGSGQFEERACGLYWCCERQAIKILARLREAYPVAAVHIYGTKPPCNVCRKRLPDMAKIDRVKVEYEFLA